MTFFDNLMVRNKIVFSFSIALLMLITIGGWAVWVAEKIEMDAAHVRSISAPFAQRATRMRREIIQIQQWLTDISATRGQDGLADGFDEAEKSYQSFVEDQRAFVKMFEEAGDLAGVEAMKSLQARVDLYYATGKKMAHAYVEEGPAAGNMIMAEFDQAAATLNAALKPFVEMQTAELDGKMEGIRQAIHQFQNGVILVCILAIIGAVVIAWFLTVSITRPLQKAVHMIKAIDQGQLDERLHLNRTDEFGTMANHLNLFADNLKLEVLAAFQNLADGNFTFQAKGLIAEPLARANQSLNKVMNQMKATSQEVAAGALHVSETSQVLSEGATEQASSLEEISGSMTEIASQVTNSAENASLASKLAVEAQRSAAQGSEQMREMVEAVTEINNAGHNISKIIKVIDEIAFQTNLLALNAAVEAARAGSHGKGFAVVAEEVRNLAARSAGAAKETASLIEGSVQKSARGSEIAGLAAQSLDEIVAGISRVTDLMAEIAAASKEQALGVAEIHAGLNQVDQVTQMNSASAEESASASETLSSQATLMKSLLAKFVLDGGTSPARDMDTGLAGTPPSPRAESPGKRGGGPLLLADRTVSLPGKKDHTEKQRPKKAHEIIRLDDDEFGRY